MSGSVSNTSSGSSASSGAASASSATSGNALTSLTDNFNDFLNLLLTQLQNQDPTQPMDTDTFTTELVQFSGVEQQITTNASLTQLIQASQGDEVIQGTSMVGKQVTLNDSDVPLQNGTASIGFTTASAEPVQIQIKNSSGVDVRDISATSNAGANTYTWDGTDNTGAQLADGAYTATVTGSLNGSTSSIPFTVTGTATGVVNSGGTVSLQVGAVTAPFSDIANVTSN